MSKKNAPKPKTSPEKPKAKPKPKPKAAKNQKQGQAQKPATKKSTQSGAVTKETVAQRAKRVFSTKKNLEYIGVMAIAIIAIIGFSTYIAGLSIGNIGGTPNPEVRATLVNGGDFTNMTESYSAQAYVVDANKMLDNSTFQFYKSWMIGVNGSAADLRLKIGDQFNGKAINGFVIRFMTTVAGYGNFSDFSVFVRENIIFRINVYKDPTIVSATAIRISTNSTNFRLRFQLSGFPDSGFAPTWNPQLHNVSMSYFTMNFTFTNVINITEFDQHPINVNVVISDPYASVGTGYQNILMLPPSLSNGNRSFSLMLQLASGLHEYELAGLPSLGNITSISFNYGPSFIKTIGLNNP